MAASKKEWMLGLPGHTDMLAREDVIRLISGGQLRENDLVKKLGEPWRAANEVPELVEYFLRPQLKPKDPPKPTTWVPKADPPRKETARVPKADPPAAPSKPAPSPPPKPEDPPPPAEPPRKLKFTRPPDPPAPPEKKPQPPSPAPEPPREEPPKKPEPPPPPRPEPGKAEAPAPTPAAPGKPETREIPRRPRREVPRLEPMVPKYFSPVDLLRAASHAFEPKKLLVSALGLLPLMVLCSMLLFLRDLVPEGVGILLFLLSAASAVFGLSVAFLALAYATRRQLESRPYTVAEVVLFAARNVSTALVYPLLALIPSLLALAALWVLGFVRDLGPGAAVTLKVLYIVPMFFALVAVGGVLAYQLASMFVPSAAAVEGEGLVGAARAAWSNIRHQPGRVVTNWLIVTVAVGVITIVCLGLMEMAVRLPDWVFGIPRDRESLKAYQKWQEFQGFFAVYRGIAYGIGLTLPVSLLSTLGMLSYLALRQPASAPLGGRVDETGGIEYAHGGLSTMEATSPADTRSGTPPPAADETRTTGPRDEEDVADDREEQTLG